MVGGVAVQGNLLCVTWSAARGHVFLFDLEAQQRVSAWTMPVGPKGYSDAAGVAMDEHYQLFVADPHNDRVCHFSAFGRQLGAFGAPAPESGDAGRDRPGVLDRPHAVALRGDLLYVAGGEGPRRRAVQRFSRQGTVLKPLASRGDPAAEFGAPRGLWADADGILVADTLHGVVQRFRGDSTFLGEVACAERGALARPLAVARLPGGALLIADRGDRPGVRLLGLDGRVLPGAAAMVEHCRDPIGFAIDGRGSVFVLDRLGERVVQFSAALEFVRVVIDLAELQDDAPGAV
jgi:hypothetical protein